MDININKNIQGNIAVEYSPVSSPPNKLHNEMPMQQKNLIQQAEKIPPFINI